MHKGQATRLHGNIVQDIKAATIVTNRLRSDRNMKTVLITGGSGYLGQFLVHDLGTDHKVATLAHNLAHIHHIAQVGYTHYSTKLPSFPGNVQDFWVRACDQYQQHPGARST